MNNLCYNCKEQCEEIIPTFNCKFQKMSENDKTELLIEFLNEFKNVHSTMYHNIDNIIEELKQRKEVIQRPVNVSTVIEDYQNLSFDDKKLVYNKMFSLGFLGESIDNKLILVSLIGSFYLAAKTKSPELTITQAIDKLVDADKLGLDYKEIQANKEKLALIVEDFLYGVNKGNTFGLKNATELRTKVNEILAQRVPF